MAINFKGAHFPPEVILMGIRWYVAYPLSTRHVEELMEECVFHGFLPPSPRECCHAIHGNVATQSRGFLPPSPREYCHPRSVATLERMSSLCALLLSMAIASAAPRCATEALTSDETAPRQPGSVASRQALRSNATLSRAVLHRGYCSGHWGLPFAHRLSL
jgi:hypothetical protein